MTQYNWKGQGYESLEALRSHLIYFDWPIVKSFLNGDELPAHAMQALSLREIPGTKPTGKQSAKKVI